MFWRWAVVSVTLLAVANDACGPLSILDEQPGLDTIAPTVMMAIASAAATFPGRCASGTPQYDLFLIAIRGPLRAVPPPSAQCLKQRGRIGITTGLGLDQIDARLLIGLLGA